ncbi:HIT-like protein [Polyplosphaeria fusca]|uniref:Aprataxin-like protein n=1 Tax=Polyplosphaeria fusca TaxID=682080 RepID=A0A9P4QN17_9PLEO|nr:HIT-like protein [Polyplosphaeria fusca]
MAPKRPKPTTPAPSPSRKKKKTPTFNPRDGLGTYITSPSSHPLSRVLEYDDEFVVINDMYPKSSVHLLLLPRDPTLSDTHPLDALTHNPSFLSSVRERVTHLKTLVATELRRRYGLNSESDTPYQNALSVLMASPSAPSVPSERDALLPAGRDWTREVIAGVHAHPSMNHLHIHVLSRDMYSECVRHKKHYLSFTTGFFVELDAFPLEEESERWECSGWPKWNMVCWRCGRGFGNRFQELKGHLAEEFEGWIRE